MKNTKAIEYELTRDGWFACAAAGLVEELAAFAVLGIEFMQTPLAVFLVLWAAFGILSSALLMGAAHLRDRSCALTACRYAAEQVVLPSADDVYDELYAAEQRYGYIPQRKAS